MKLIKHLGMEYASPTSKRKENYGLYECGKCGNHIRVLTKSVKGGKTTRCWKCAKITHGKSNEKLYDVWITMRRRCHNPSSNRYVYYGKRGISVCSEWRKDFKSFYDWSLENGYTIGLTLDRIDTNGNYEPSNCRFVTRNIQNRNTKKIRKSNTSGYRGVSLNKQRGRFVASIMVDNKQKFLGYFIYPWTAAYIYDSYIINNNLEHTMNLSINSAWIEFY